MTAKSEYPLSMLFGMPQRLTYISSSCFFLIYERNQPKDKYRDVQEVMLKVACTCVAGVGSPAPDAAGRA